MKAELVFKRKFAVTTRAGRRIVVFADLYRLPKPEKKSGAEKFKFSWIAFDSENESRRVLMDCHEPKGPHIHFDDDKDGQVFRWTGIDAAWVMFFDTIRSHFGDLIEEE